MMLAGLKLTLCNIHLFVVEPLMSKSRRSQIITDEKVQGVLLHRVMMYWITWSLFLQVFAVACTAAYSPPQPFTSLLWQSISVTGPATLVTMFILPFVLIDILRVTSRFVGPIQNIRHAMRQLAHGQPARHVQFRRDDYWHELSNLTNLVAQRMEKVNVETCEAEDEDYDFDEDIPCTDRLRVVEA